MSDDESGPIDFSRRGPIDTSDDDQRYQSVSCNDDANPKISDTRETNDNTGHVKFDAVNGTAKCETPCDNQEQLKSVSSVDICVSHEESFAVPFQKPDFSSSRYGKFCSNLLNPPLEIQSYSQRNVQRPFKMYPIDPFSMYSLASPHMSASTPPITSSIQWPDLTSPLFSPSPIDGAFNSFSLSPLTSQFLNRKRRCDSKSILDSPEKISTKATTNEQKDDSYWERRRKNNDAAKRSRDARRCKEEEIAMRAAFLEQENLKLRAQVAILKNETTKLHYMLYNR